MHLSFALPPDRTADTVRAGFAALASELVGRPVVLTRAYWSPLDDQNGAGAAYRAQWADGDVTLDETVQSASGNPRDGYGYEFEHTLRIAGTDPAVELRACGGGWEPLPAQLDLTLRGVPAARLPQLRQTLCDLYGEAADRCAEPTLALANAEALAAAGEVETACAWAKQAIASSNRGSYGREQVVEWLARQAEPSLQLADQLREAPCQVPLWRAARAAPPSGWPAPDIAEALRRLCPFDRELAAAGPWSVHPDWPGDPAAFDPDHTWQRAVIDGDHVPLWLVETAIGHLTGLVVGRDWQVVYGEMRPPDARRWAFSVQRKAAMPAGGRVPVVHVEMHATLRSAADWQLPPATLALTPPSARAQWHLVSCGDSGETAAFVWRTDLGERSERRQFAWTVTGSDAFAARVAKAVSDATPLRWRPCNASQALQPVPRTPVPWMAGLAKLSAVERVAAALRGIDAQASDQALFAELVAQCKCSQPRNAFCVHKQRMLQRQREVEAIGWQGSSGERARQAARVLSEALGAAFEAIGDPVSAAAVDRRVKACAEAARLLAGM